MAAAALAAPTDAGGKDSEKVRRLAGEIFDKFDEDQRGIWDLAAASAHASATMGKELDEQSFLLILFLALQHDYLTQEDFERGMTRDLVVSIYTDKQCQKRLQLSGWDAHSHHARVFAPAQPAQAVVVLAGHKAKQAAGGPPQKGDTDLRHLVTRFRTRVMRCHGGVVPRNVKPSQADRLPANPETFEAKHVVLLLEALREVYQLPILQEALKEASTKFGAARQVDYFTFVKEATAILQQQVFPDFGLTAPPSGVATLRRLCARYDTDDHPEVQELASACKELLGVDSEITISFSKDVPFFRQTEPGNCLQTNMKMVLKWFFPERDYSLKDLDSSTGRTSRGKWTSTPQAMPALVSEGLDAHFYSSGPLRELVEIGRDFLWGHYGERVAKIFLENSDFDSLVHAISMLLQAGRYTLRKLHPHEIEQAFLDEGCMIIMLVDYTKLFKHSAYNPSGKSEDYSGHFVTLTGFGPRFVQIHDSLGQPNKIVEKERLWEAWNADGTDHDCIIVKGKMARKRPSDEPLRAGFPEHLFANREGAWS